ncbi:MAG TPA: histidine kinase dimerization/phospho-acceptor domain-containing protein, partial [Gammaproteobacteria bacterium]|nr:histidine kinase dimerization/phospho-acceptor domain-containing protein [Gammaproteobacteria bacterium]
MQEDRHGERAHQARLANIRQELLTPANAILAYSQMTQEALDGREPEGAREDLDRIRDAADRLADMVDRLLEDQSPEDGDGEAEERIRSHLRHDLRTPINAIKGYGEMLVEDVEEAGAGNEALETDLRNLLTEANRMLTRI